MSDFDSLREDFAQAFDAINSQSQAVNRFCTSTAVEIDKLWDDNAELRDELHAVANRLEALTAFVTSNPAEVAARIVTLREAPDA
jgi:cytochrome c556